MNDAGAVLVTRLVVGLVLAVPEILTRCDRRRNPFPQVILDHLHRARPHQGRAPVPMVMPG